MKDVKIISLDLEMNKPIDNRPYSIIQVGACVFNLQGEILDTYNAYINCKEILDPFIINLTGIKQEQVDNGITLQDAYSGLVDMHKKHDCLINFAQWGHGDSELLRNQLGLDNEWWIGGRRSIDVKTVFITWCFANGFSRQAGLAKALIRLGMEFKGQKHSAIDDSINTALIYCELLKRLKNGE